MIFPKWRSGNIKSGLITLPGLLKQIIEADMWQQFLVEQTGEVVEHKSFSSFVTMHPPEGLGATIEMLMRLCSEHQDVIDLIDQVTQGKNGGDRRSEEIKNSLYIVQTENTLPTGNTRQAGLRRLRSEIKKAPTPERKTQVEQVQAKKTQTKSTA